MNKKNIIFKIYNELSDDVIKEEEINQILPKLYLIMNKVKLDVIEIIETIDVLREINQKNRINQINPEIIDLIIKATSKDMIILEENLYFPMVLKHLILPFKENICQEDYNIVMFLSEFEIFLDLAKINLNKKDLSILDKYNHELKQIVTNYKECMNIYEKHVKNDVILDEFIAHFATILYFNLDEFNYDYDVLLEILIKIMENYYSFIDYCCSTGIHKNFTRINPSLESVGMEYKISYDMLKLFYDNKNKNTKIKRK